MVRFVKKKGMDIGMRFAVLACRVFTRELSYAVSCCENLCCVYWVEQGLHNTPAVLQKHLQQQIDEIEAQQEELDSESRFDAILLGYGLCSNGIVGLRTRTLPLVAPRCDDCMALFLGSQKRYLELFHAHHGVYWYNSGWVEIGRVPSKKWIAVQQQKYTELYGEDNAEYLIETEYGPLSHYDTCIFIKSPVYHSEALISYSRECATDFDWNFHVEPGSQAYLEALLSGYWPEEQFLVCAPGAAIEAGNSEEKIRADLQ